MEMREDGGDAPRCSYPNEPMTMIHGPHNEMTANTSPSRKDGGRYSSAIEPLQTHQ
jgi:hypothetical protein